MDNTGMCDKPRGKLYLFLVLAAGFYKYKKMQCSYTHLEPKSL